MKPSCFSVEIDLSLQEELKNDLLEQGFKLERAEYTIFSAKKEGVVVNLYKSGKLTVQGKNKDDFIEFYLEPKIIKNFSYTNPEAFHLKIAHIGSDESGKGDFFGPLVVASVYADEEGIKKLIELNVQDSKRLSDASVIKKAKEIKKTCAYKILILRPAKYNELYGKMKNLNRLLAWAHSVIIKELKTATKAKMAIVDKFADDSLLKRFFKDSDDFELIQKVRAEEDIVVAAASILARDSFLFSIEDLSKKYGVTLPKGVNSNVKSVALSLAKKEGKEVLLDISKAHFKTFEEIQALLKEEKR